MYALIYAAVGAACAVWTHRGASKVSYLRDSYDGSARTHINALLDRSAKRLLNTAYLVVSGFFVELYLLLTSVLYTGMSMTEALISILSSSVPVGLILFILVKDLFYKHVIDSQFDAEAGKRFRKYAGITLGISAAYWAVIVTLVLLLNKHISVPINLIILAAVIYLIAVIVSNFVFRGRVVFRNVNINVKRIVFVGACILCVISYQIMKMDIFVLQPYISTVKIVKTVPDTIDYDKSTGVYTITTDKEDFKILQLTDIHLGGSIASVVKDYKALNACQALIERTKPDLVIVTGDLTFPLGVMSFSLNNTAPIIEFANFMRNTGVPWAFTYGNHDTEVIANGSVEEVINTFKSLSYETSGNLLYPYIQPDITGRSNQLIKIRGPQGELVQALFLLDSNDYIGGVNDYDYIHDDEVKWYKNQVEKMNAEEGRTVSSLLFFHMPLQEYRTANDLYEAGSDEVRYFFGENKEKMIDKVCCSKYPSKLFDTAKELGSTKAMFCGHDHYNNMSVEYEGIRLTYGMSIDYLAMPGIDKDTAQRGATLITLHGDSTYDIEQVKLAQD